MFLRHYLCVKWKFAQQIEREKKRKLLQSSFVVLSKNITRNESENHESTFLLYRQMLKQTFPKHIEYPMFIFLLPLDSAVRAHHSSRGKWIEIDNIIEIKASLRRSIAVLMKHQQRVEIYAAYFHHHPQMKSFISIVDKMALLLFVVRHIFIKVLFHHYDEQMNGTRSSAERLFVFSFNGCVCTHETTQKISKANIYAYIASILYDSHLIIHIGGIFSIVDISSLNGIWLPS